MNPAHGTDRAALARQQAIQWLVERYHGCSKCHGQYARDGWTCHCYQCCFEWDLRDSLVGVLRRARRKHMGQRPAVPGLHESWGAPLPVTPLPPDEPMEPEEIKGWLDMPRRAVVKPGGDGAALPVLE